MQIRLLVLLVFGALQVQAQYYFQHLVAAERSAKQYNLLRQNKVRQVKATLTAPDGEADPNFLLEQRLDAASNTLVTQTGSDFTGRSVMVSTHNTQGQVLQVLDSSSSIVNRSAYTYNAQGQLQQLRTQSADSMQQYMTDELFLLEYDKKGFPSGMLRIRNNTDTTRVIFLASENGQPGEEHWWRNNRRIETWYYYYDDKGRLTDVARFNARANRILPDYMFEYDAQDRVVQQTTIQGAGSYRIWQYQYDARGLKTAELVFNKNRQQEGRINYQYQ